MQTIKFTRPVTRATQANKVELSSPTKFMSIYYSYLTPVGVFFRDYETRESWAFKYTYPSRTTGRHINEFGIRGYPETSEEELHSKIAEGMAHIGLDLFKHRLAGGAL